MRDYAKVSPKFWTGLTGKSLRKHPEAQIVAFYLMTCPTSEMTGVFVCPLIYIAHETGLGEEGALKGLARLYEIDFCTFDEASETIFVHEMAKYQIGEELKVNDNQVKSVRKAFSAMKGIIRERFFERYEASFHLSDESPCKAPSKPRTRTSEGTGAETETRSAPDGACAEPQSASTPAVVEIPIIGGKEFPVTQKHADEWIAAYPAVDVVRQLAAMRQWCLANPAKRKTARGVLAFCNAWLMREQDKPHPQARGSPVGYESAKDRSRREASEQLTGRKQNEQRHDIIDIN